MQLFEFNFEVLSLGNLTGDPGPPTLALSLSFFG